MAVEPDIGEGSRIEQDIEAIDHDEEKLRLDTERLEPDIEDERRGVDITVNKKPVHLTHRRVDGLAIKLKAIDQSVNIELDFQLFEKHGERWEQIGDNEEITVHEGAVFRAVSPDDNS
jgi:hypothetical protein